MILTITPNPAIDNVYFVENFSVGEVNRPIYKTKTAGGKGLNVARVSKILGAKVSAGGFLGGYNGDFIKEEIKKLDILDQFTKIKGDTRDCFNITDKLTCKSTELLEKGPFVTDDEVENFFSNFKKTCNKYDVIAISGSLPEGVDISFFKKIVNIAKVNNKKIIVDTSGEGLKMAIEAKPFMVKPNKYELLKYYGTDILVEDALINLYNEGIELPVVSLGKDGCMAYINNKFYKFKTPNIPVKNAVGSGDSFIAGVCVGLGRYDNFIDIIKLAMACGTANTQFLETGIVSYELVDKYFKEIKVKLL